ncbi:Gfo/Idh/MocA family protein [Streptomyces deccanensis]|uniref:Gfo/Idh/MocA family protein n=1 Tax=Streptomyces deccanensis TaxID=424188 RepID=UPI001EFB0BB5|nr:Gfo/Idh/MocA family oxidoreductase [Streptomyces deccanensis]ULR51518.1 Gfo/Idh/MocA family oxidoreductase [Streptomyces deccanensis]
MTAVRMGVMGCADIALRRMLPAMAATSEVEITAVASRDPARARAVAGRFGAAPVHGYAELLRRPDVDAVYLPLPAALHAEWTEAALRADKHVLAEKPLTTDAARTRELVALAQARRLALCENVMFVHHPQHTAVRKLLADGAIGRLRSFHASFTVPARPADDIRYRADLGGGALWDTGVYPVRAAQLVLGDGLTVEGAVLTSDPGRPVDTGGAVLLRSPGGVTAQLRFGLDDGYRSAYELCGTEGRLTVERAFTPPAGHRPVLRLERGTAVEHVELAEADQVTATVAAFAGAVAEGRPVDADAVLAQAALLDAVRRRATG